MDQQAGDGLADFSVDAAQTRTLSVVCGGLARRSIEADVERYSQHAGISWRLVSATRSPLSWQLQIEARGQAWQLDGLAGLLYREVPGYDSTGKPGSRIKRALWWVLEAWARGG